MRTRGNIRVHDGNPARGVILYSHWDADVLLPAAVKAGLNRAREVWEDFPYLTRVIFTDLVREDLESTSGYGLVASLKDTDGTNRVLGVDCRTQRVTYIGDWGDLSGESLSFEQVIAS